MLSRLRAQQKVRRPSDKFLQRIGRLDRSSPDFSNQLIDLFREKGYGVNQKLEREDQQWFVEYLDNVRALIALYLFSLNLL